MAWQPQDVVGAYQITEELGSGGMATVYRAYHERLDRDVAIKVMHAAFQSDSDFLARFDREAKIVARLEHPHIVPVYDFDEHNNQPYLVMKYLDGRSLKNVLDERTLTLDEIVRILDAVADALAYAHEQGVLHRDVKPSNIILDERGTPYLTDFGLARIAQTGESTLSAGMIVGTPNYVSPEQAEGNSSITERSDVYSLGVLLYEMVVGRLPFKGHNPYATVHKHIYEQPPLPSEVNPEVPTQVEMVLLQALEKDPAARQKSPRALAQDFKQAVQQAGLTSLSADRSGVFQSDVVPASDDDYAGVPKPKPKRGKDFSATLLLLEDEESWANLPREEIAQRRLKKRQGERIGLIGHAIPYLAVNTMIVSNGLFESGGLNLGAFIPALGWGAGLAAHAIGVYFGERRQVEKLYRDFDERMVGLYGRDWRADAPEVDIYREWRKAQEVYDERKGFAIHAGVFVMINILIWLTWVIASMDSSGFVFPYPLIVTAAWGLGLFSNWNEVRTQSRFQNSHESVLAEMDMIAGYSSAPRKLKNQLDDSSGPRLTGDGEFTDSTVEKLERGRH